MTIPDGVSAACQAFGVQLGHLAVDLATQTVSATLVGWPELTRLRVSVSSSCEAYQETLEALSDPLEPDMLLLDQAADERLFSTIAQWARRFEELMDGVMDEFGHSEARWHFAVSFSVRAMASSVGTDGIGQEIREIFYGAADAVAPPFPVPESVAEAMAWLVSMSGTELSLGDAEQAGMLAQQILDHFLTCAQPTP